MAAKPTYEELEVKYKQSWEINQQLSQAVEKVYNENHHLKEELEDTRKKLSSLEANVDRMEEALATRDMLEQ